MLLSSKKNFFFLSFWRRWSALANKNLPVNSNENCRCNLPFGKILCLLIELQKHKATLSKKKKKLQSFRLGRSESSDRKLPRNRKRECNITATFQTVVNGVIVKQFKCSSTYPVPKSKQKQHSQNPISSPTHILGTTKKKKKKKTWTTIEMGPLKTRSYTNVRDTSPAAHHYMSPTHQITRLVQAFPSPILFFGLWTRSNTPKYVFHVFEIW